MLGTINILIKTSTMNGGARLALSSDYSSKTQK